MKRFAAMMICILFCFGASAQTAENTSAESAAEVEASPPPPAPTKPRVKARTLDELLQHVRQGWNKEREQNQQREERFKADRDNQDRLLKESLATLKREEARSEELEIQFRDGELSIAQYEDTLLERMGTLGELFGVVRQVAGDSRAQVENSPVSAQIPGREVFLKKLGSSKSLPSIESLERLWFILHQEMTELGKVASFPATVVTADGKEVQRNVVRVGAFNLISAGKYLVWDSEIGKIAELARQPTGIHMDNLEAFADVTSGMAPLSIDPTRGSILRMLVKTPDPGERIDQGGIVGYTVIILGAAALLLGLVRGVVIMIAVRKVATQKGSSELSTDNPLGRVLTVYEENRNADTETLELKLDEVIMRESVKLDRFLWAVKVVSVVAPLLGLLGTVTGMIQTFQAITLFGTGDATMMAGGISEALVTTMLGLIVAIPLVLLHSVLLSNSRGVVEILEEQSIGLVARRSGEGDAVS